MNVPLHLDRIAAEAGYEVMGLIGILGILWNRETLSDDQLLTLTSIDVTDLYDSFIGPAVDNIEDYLIEKANQ